MLVTDSTDAKVAAMPAWVRKALSHPECRIVVKTTLQLNLAFTVGKHRGALEYIAKLNEVQRDALRKLGRAARDTGNMGWRELAAFENFNLL